MSKSLVVTLIVFSVLWIILIFRLIRKGRISVKYSMVWFFVSIVLLIVGLFPKIMEIISEFFGFLTISNLVIGIILSLLLLLTLYLTIIITNQKTQINNLIQEVSILKEKK